MFHYIMLACKGFEGKEQMLLSRYATKPNIELDNGWFSIENDPRI